MQQLIDYELLISILEELESLQTERLHRIANTMFMQAVNDDYEYKHKHYTDSYGQSIDLLNRMRDLVYNIKKQAVGDKQLNIPIKIPTSRFQVQVEIFWSRSEMNTFLKSPDVEYVDLIVKDDAFYLSYRTIEIDK